MDICVLGPVEVSGPAGLIGVGGPKARAVLAQLVAVDGRPLSIERLIAGVWGDDPTPGARSTLQTYISDLRAAIEGAIQRHGDGYALAVDREQVDVARFEDGVATGRRHLVDRPAQAAAWLAAALAEWRGPAYEDVVQHELIHGEAVRLDGLRLAALEDRIDADMACGHHARVVPELDVLTEQHPYRERFCAQHMVALYRCGRQAAALASYQRALCSLRELGIDPLPMLQELELRILQHNGSLSLPS